MRQDRAFTKEGEEVKGWYCKVRGRHYIIPDDARVLPLGYTDGPPCLEGFVEVIGESVGQSIGKFDKKRTKKYPKGQEIYGSIEIDGKMSKGGDIVEITRSIQTGSRRCRSGRGRRYDTYAINTTLTFNGAVKFGEYKTAFKEYKVIGNQTQNPELLEVKND